MKRGRFNKIFIIIFFCTVYSAVQSQPILCPPNLDFEAGNLSFWECRTGHVYANNGVNEILWEDVGQALGRHTIIPSSDNTLDFYGGFPKRSPGGSGFSLRLGNDFSAYEAEGVFYTIDIPASATNFSLLYQYAIVLQDPDHTPAEQPRFRAQVVDAATGELIDCVSFDFTASASLPGFRTSTVSPNVVYKSWTSVSVNLGKYAGKSVILEFMTSDCTQGGHFGYAYFDVSSNCDGTIPGSAICGSNNNVILSAPLGYQAYQWFSNSNFTNLISVQQTLFLTPPPPVNSVFPVIVTPYAGFGCTDTIYATIIAAPKPPANAGPDKVTCSKTSVELGAPPNSLYSYSWSPAAFLSNAAVANPTTLTNMTGPVNFILQTTNRSSGCFSYDTVLVTPVFADTSTSVAGKLIYCAGENLNTTLTVNNTSATVQWFQNGAAIGGATGLSYRPLSLNDDTYYAVIDQNGCRDTTRSYRIYVSSAPDASFRMPGKINCLNYPVSFTNTTTIAAGEQLNYSWEFSDGTIMNSKDVTKAFNVTGDYFVTLTATSPGGCKDEHREDFVITDDCGVFIPSAFTPNKDGLNDLFIPVITGFKSITRFSVYNRFGNLVFTTNKAGEGWDGNYKGMPQPAGTFVWMLEYINRDDKPIMYKGTVTLIR